MAARRTLSFEATTAPTARLLHLRWDLSGVCLRAALFVGLATAFIAAALTFRLGAQFVAWTPLPAPASWLYDLGSAFASPFGRYETARPVDPGTGMEFAGLVALEAYLIAGLVLLLGLLGLRALARDRIAAGHTLHLGCGAALGTARGPATLAGEKLRYGLGVGARRRDAEGVNAALRPLLSFETLPAPPSASRRRAGRRARPAAPYTRA
jgi:hypothetical protein